MADIVTASDDVFLSPRQHATIPLHRIVAHEVGKIGHGRTSTARTQVHAR